MTSSCLTVWQHLPEDQQLFKTEQGATVLNVELLKTDTHGASSFSSINVGTLPPFSVSMDLAMLEILTKLSQPNAILKSVQVLRKDDDKLGLDPALRSKKAFITDLKLAGLLDIKVNEEAELKTRHEHEIKKALKLNGDFQLLSIEARCPNFEIGSSQLLSYVKKDPVKKVEEEADASSKKAWLLDDLDDDEVELIDQDDLLDEEDMIKPDENSLRVVSSGTGKKKACKNCSCGLKEMEEEEEAQEKKKTKGGLKKQPITSSCGSCYLGDAFRCAGCPYLGMPAFKPGEKIELSQRQLTADQ